MKKIFQCENKRENIIETNQTQNFQSEDDLKWSFKMRSSALLRDFFFHKVTTIEDIDNFSLLYCTRMNFIQFKKFPI